MDEKEIRPFRLVAIIKGRGDSATVGLYVERKGDFIIDLPWPKDWPERVTPTLLEDHGFELESAEEAPTHE